MNPKRLRKIEEEIKRIISQAIMLEMKDPRLPAIITINSVDVTADLKTATIYVSALGDADFDQQAMVDILNKAKGFFRNQIGRDLKVFNTPEPHFVYDDSIVKGMEMDRLLRKLTHEQNEHAPESDPPDSEDR